MTPRSPQMVNSNSLPKLQPHNFSVTQKRPIWGLLRYRGILSKVKEKQNTKQDACVLQWHKNVLCIYSDKNWKMFVSFIFYKKYWVKLKNTLYIYMLFGQNFDERSNYSNNLFMYKGNILVFVHFYKINQRPLNTLFEWAWHCAPGSLYICKHMFVYSDA